MGLSAKSEINKWATRNPLDRKVPFEKDFGSGLTVVFERKEGGQGGLRQRLIIKSDSETDWYTDTQNGEVILRISGRPPVYMRRSRLSHVAELTAVMTLPRGKHNWSVEIGKRKLIEGSHKDLVPSGLTRIFSPNQGKEE